MLDGRKVWVPVTSVSDNAGVTIFSIDSKQGFRFSMPWAIVTLSSSGVVTTSTDDTTSIAGLAGKQLELYWACRGLNANLIWSGALTDFLTFNATTYFKILDSVLPFATSQAAVAAGRCFVQTMVPYSNQVML